MESDNLDMIAFQNDLQNGLGLFECCRKHNVSFKDAVDYAMHENRAINMRNNQKQQKNQKPSESNKANKHVIKNNNAYIRRNKCGTFTIYKHFSKGNGKWKNKYYGTYLTIEDARTIRDELIASDWNRNELESIKSKCNIRDSWGR